MHPLVYRECKMDANAYDVILDFSKQRNFDAIVDQLLTNAEMSGQLANIMSKTDSRNTMKGMLRDRTYAHQMLAQLNFSISDCLLHKGENSLHLKYAKVKTNPVAERPQSGRHSSVQLKHAKRKFHP
jgi:hypothetical protein